MRHIILNGTLARLKYWVLVVFSIVFCQNAFCSIYSGSAWDEIVNDNYRPSSITIDDSKNYIIHIKSSYQLAWYAWKTRTETNEAERGKYTHATIYLDSDIDLSGYSWRAIGEKGNRSNDFVGTFDGQGHTISNMVAERFNGDNGAGLFDYLPEKCEIRNVRFYNCKSYSEDRAGIVAGGVHNSGNVKFSNLTFDNCYIEVSDENAGFVIGGVEGVKDILFDNITVKNCHFGNKRGQKYGGLVGAIAWGDCSVTVKNCFISARNYERANYRTGGIAGYMDHGSNLYVDNCVIDMFDTFFTEQNDQGAIVGNWQNTSKPKASHVLVVANPDIPNGKNVGLFAGYCGSSSAMELSDCFIDYGKMKGLDYYHVVSKQIYDKGKCVANNIIDLDHHEASAREAGRIVRYNRTGACFGINPNYTENNNLMDFVIPLTDPAKGKLLGFSGKDYVSEVSGGVRSDFTKHTNYDYVVMAQGQKMNYTVTQKANKWVIADNTTSMSDKKRIGKWKFEGVPTGEGELKFDFVDLPIIQPIDNLCSYNTVTQRVTLKWQVKNADVFKDYWKLHGKWHIYRNNVLIDSLDAGKDSWTDLSPASGTNTYNVYFVSNEYMYDKGDNVQYFKKSFTTRYSVSLKESNPVISNNKVVNTIGIPNASALNGCRVRLLKWDTARDIECGHNLDNIIAKADALKVFEEKFLYNQQKDDEYLNVTYEDEASGSSLCTTYYYLWIVDNIQDSRFTQKVVRSQQLTLINDSEIKFKSFSATKGKSTSKVTLKWNAENKNNESIRYAIERKTYNDTADDKWTNVYETTSSLNTGSYEDEVLPGYVYRYRIRLYPFCESSGANADYKSEASDIGFAASRGTIQGRITYNSGSSNVEGVDVRLQSENDELAQSMTSYAMQFFDSDQAMPLAGGLGNDFWNGEWTLQFLLRTDGEKPGRLLTLPGMMCVNVACDTLIHLGNDTSFGIPVNYGTYMGNYILLQHDSNGYRLGNVVYDTDTQDSHTIWTQTYSDEAMSEVMSGEKTDTLWFGHIGNAESFIGAVDEIRLWEGCLSDKSISDTYNRYLSGNEKGLMAYYTFDSGVKEYAFDSSHPSGNWNNRNMTLSASRPLLTSVIIPESNVLAYRGITDKNGEYTISGIPFEGEGTNWQIVPSYGSHDFSPTSARRLISTNTLVHTGIDFTDVSSFKVSGKVYYEHTNIPVQGCNIMIDGVAVSENAKAAETNADGEFTVDVPIGTHTLAMSMNGHTFTDSLTLYFNKPVKDLWFYDNTKTVVAGKVVGGELEYSKPLGLAQSKNNVGTAYITLKPANDNYYFTAHTDKNNLYLVPSETQVDYHNALRYSNNSWAHTGKAVSESDRGDANRIYIKTDSLTGEFAVSLPPMRYEVIDITIPSADESINTKLKNDLGYLDARNTTEQLTDSVWNGQIDTDSTRLYDKFTYNAVYTKAVTTPAILSVWQDDDDTNFFGEDSITYNDNTGKAVAFSAYKEGKYTIGAEGSEKRPVFNQFQDYTLYIKAIQKYQNRDDKNNIVEDIMPMPNKTVTINNGMSYENYWYVDNNGKTSFEETDGTEFQLDSLGFGAYKFRVGVPNTTAPYEETLSMVLGSGTTEFNLTGIVLGAVSYGNSFVTRGPSVVSMILRDPPGSNSFATWKKGSSVITGYSKKEIDETHHGENSEVNLGFAPDLKSDPMGIMGGKYGAHASETQDHVGIYGDNTSSGFTNTITATQDISTSSAPEFDGPDADIFIGSSINSVSGNGKQVTVIMDAEGPRLGVKDVKTSAFTFNTSFVYSQYQIKKSVIPNLLAERRNLIEDPATVPVDSNLHYLPKVDYQQWLSMTDEEKDALLNKGLGEGYDIKTSVEQYATDSVSLYKSWADDWKNLLRSNEQAKVEAYNGNYLKDNYTFDAASKQTFTTTTDELKVINDKTDLDGDIDDAHVGIKGYFGPIGDTKIQYHYYNLTRNETRNYRNEDNQEAFSYTLAENGVNDVLTVDRMTAPDGFADIFRTRAGQTSGFWAPQYVTEYYLPGTEIMAPTLMVNKPRLELVDPEQQIISNVRRGTAATVQFRLINDSEAKCNGYYRMCLESETNTGGARCTFNGLPLNNDGVLVWLEYGKPQVITVNIEEPQNPVDGTYNLKFYLIDNKQTLRTGPMKIYPSEVPVIVKFVKSSSEISLATDKSVINAESIKTGNGKIHFTLSDYDVNMENLLYLDLQMWNGTKYISIGDSARWERTKGMPESVSYTLDMSDINAYPDGEYLFRARTVSNYGEGEVEAYSTEEITVLKDTSAPQPSGNLMPLRGVLGNDNEISVEFNEDIFGDIRKHTNVELYGQYLASASARDVSVFFNGKDDRISTDVPMSALQTGAARSFNLWIKWMGGEGTILSLGTSVNSNRFGIDDEGHLTIYSNKNTLVSENKFEKGKWTFISLITDATNPTEPTHITASYILEDGKDIVWLFGDKYGGVHFNGESTPAASFVLGNGFHGYMQDLSMWDGVRDMETANAEKSLKKTRYTPNLMAYWPLNEGYGKAAMDIVSEQNMYLSSENMWSIDNKNYAMRLDSGQRAQLIFSSLNTGYDEDYLLQAWFNADESIYEAGSSETDTLISYPGGTTSFVIPRSTGQLVLLCKNDSVILTSKNIADGHWHQLSFMVKKSENGNAVAYLDGNNIGQVPSRKIDTMTGQLFLGDSHGFSGYFDEIRIWNGLQNSQTISENLTNRYSTTDCPVAAYFPFEVSGPNQAVDFTLANYGNMKAEGDTVRLVVTDPDIPISQLTISQETVTVPPLRNAPTLVTRDFSFISSERKIWINISDKEARDIQGTTATALVRGLHDKAGNIIQDIRWSFYVEMNDIDWNKFVTLEYDEELFGSMVGYATIVNNTGSEQDWHIEGVPSWMELSHYSGILKPGEELTIDISAKESIPIGTNNGMLTLVDGGGICHKHHYSIENIPNSPDWKVDSLYSQVMTVTGQVRISGVIQENEYSQLAAFNSLGDCVGVVNPKYVREKNSYYYTLMIYGNDWYIGKDITFKYYDASTGTYYASVEPDEPIIFGGDYARYGSIDTPVYWNTTGKIEQTIPIGKGWNWISFNVQETDSIAHILVNPPADSGQAPIYTEVKDKNNFARYYNGRWEFDDDFGTLTFGRMYKVKAEAVDTISRIGKPANLLGSRIRLVGMRNDNPGWTWIGANVTTSMPLTTALGGMTARPQPGDIIKNYTQYAEYTTSGWMGDLTTITPGKGYMYMSNDTSDKYLVYPVSNSGMPQSSVRLTSATDDDDLYAEYAGTATVIAAVESEGERMAGCSIHAVDDEGHVHGIKTVSAKDDRHLAYLVVHGNEPETIHFKVHFGEGDNQQTYESATTLYYYDGLQAGTSDEPLIITITGASAITPIRTTVGEPCRTTDTLYDLSGRPVPEAATLSRGIYIKNNRKQVVK